MKKTYVFKKNFIGNSFNQVTSQAEYLKLDSDDFYNKLVIVDNSEYEATVYVPIILGTAEQVSDEFIEWLESVGKGLINPTFQF